MQETLRDGVSVKACPFPDLSLVVSDRRSVIHVVNGEVAHVRAEYFESVWKKAKRTREVNDRRYRSKQS